MLVVLKSFAGVDYEREDGSVLSIQGSCFLNDVSDDDIKLLRSKYNFDELEAKGHVTIGAKGNQTQIDDTLQSATDAQKKAIKANEQINKTKIVQN